MLSKANLANDSETNDIIDPNDISDSINDSDDINNLDDVSDNITDYINNSVTAKAVWRAAGGIASMAEQVAGSRIDK